MQVLDHAPSVTGARRSVVLCRVLVLACVVLGGVVSPAWAVQPSLSTSATGSVVVGGQVFDTAALSGGAAPTGTVTFRLYWPGDTGCTRAPVFTSMSAVGAGGATSSPFTATVAGTYRWTATYAGDANNSPVASVCNAPNESVAVTKASPTIASNASGTVALGGQISDTATVSGRFEGGFVPCAVFAPPGAICVDSPRPGPVIIFSVFGPDNAGCTGAPVFSSMKFSDAAVSAPFTPTAPGTYRWTTSYPGDGDNGNNNAAFGQCNAPNESVVVTSQASGDTTKPALTALSMSPASFRAAGAGPSAASASGSKVSYTLSEAASIAFKVERPVPGRRVRGKCVSPKRSNRTARKCTRYVTLPGSFTRKGEAGSNTFRFTGRLRGRKLAPGSYRLRGEATDSAGNTSVRQRLRFRIVAR